MKKLLAIVMVLGAPVFISTGAWALSVFDIETGQDGKGETGNYYAGGTYHDSTGTLPYAHDIIPAGQSDWSVTGFMANQVPGSRIEVVFSGTYFGSQWANPGNSLGGKPGDLYISSGGWGTSSGSAADHWASDKFNTSEGWNYVVSYGQSLFSHSGNKWMYSATLYNLTNGYLTTSNATNVPAYPTFDSFRSDQAWRGGYGDEVTTTNTYAILDMDAQTLTFIFYNLYGWDPAQLGYHWTMGCGNDVVEGGGTPVPEPESLLLLGLVLAGFGVYRWKAVIVRR